MTINAVYLTTENKYARIIAWNKSKVFCYKARVYATLSDAFAQADDTVLDEQYYSPAGAPLYASLGHGYLILSECKREKLKLTL